MKNIFWILLFFSTALFSQQDYNTKKGFAAEGYDVVAYFKNKAIKGDKKNIATFDGVKYRFISKENLITFKKNPLQYIPQYGGYCAYAIGKNSAKVSINPKTFEIRNGKLFLFYNSWGTNTLKLWSKEGADLLKKRADKNWELLKMKS